jgi:DNA-binding response OmpR family regulator
MQLAEAGYHPVSATDIPQALEAARRQKPAVVLLDHGLPLQPGLSAVGALRREPALADAAIVLVSARKFADTEVSHLDGYLQKPWDPKELLGTVERCLEERGGVGVAG